MKDYMLFVLVERLEKLIPCLEQIKDQDSFRILFLECIDIINDITIYRAALKYFKVNGVNTLNYSCICEKQINEHDLIIKDAINKLEILTENHYKKLQEGKVYLDSDLCKIKKLKEEF